MMLLDWASVLRGFFARAPCDVQQLRARSVTHIIEGLRHAEPQHSEDVLSDGNCQIS